MCSRNTLLPVAEWPPCRRRRVRAVATRVCRSSARLAQSVEHQTFNLRVAGSSPSSGVSWGTSSNGRALA